MDRHKMLMGKETKKVAIPKKRKTINETRTLNIYELGLDGSFDIEDTISRLKELQKEEKAKGNFVINISVGMNGEYDDFDTEILLTTQRYENDADIAKREAAEKKKEEKRRLKAEKMKKPEYQKSLIDKMNKNVSRKMGWSFGYDH